MMKLAIFACLCAAVLVESQDPLSPAQGPPARKHVRVARQSMGNGNSGQPMQGNNGGNGGGNLGMQGLGNIPDPTAILAKMQEVARQLMSGRRRREAQGPPVNQPMQGNNGNGGGGNLGMQGLGNLPDPTAILAKMQELARQFLGGRRRRHAQAPPVNQPMQGNNGNNGGGNLGMQGLGNIPDPTAILAKMQEIARQFIGGRRRRHAEGPPHGHGDHGHHHEHHHGGHSTTQASA